MIPFLKEEIERLEPCRHKVLHLQTVKNDLKQHHEELSIIVSQTKKQCILDEMEMEEEQDQLMLAKFAVMEQARQKQQELQMALLEKNRIMKQCELNEEKLLKYREELNQLQAKSQKISAQKTKMIRDIRENEVICQRVCLENKQLRERCEEQIKRVSECTVERENTKMENGIKKTIEENIQMAESIIRLTEPLHEKTIKLNSLDCCEDKKKIASLKHELQLQNREKFLMKSQLKCEQIKFIELSARVQAKLTANSIRDNLCATSEEDQSNLWTQIKRERQRHDQLQAKLSQFRKIKQQMQQMHQKLSQNYSACTSSDLRGVKQMGKASSRFERNIHQQKHFLQQRYSIVDSYRKYLKNT